MLTIILRGAKVVLVMPNDEQDNTNKVPISAKLDPNVFAAVSRLAVDDDRSLSNMIERLLKRSPEVAELLEAEVAANA